MFVGFAWTHLTSSRLHHPSVRLFMHVCYYKPTFSVPWQDVDCVVTVFYLFRMNASHLCLLCVVWMVRPTPVHVPHTLRELLLIIKADARQWESGMVSCETGLVSYYESQNRVLCLVYQTLARLLKLGAIMLHLTTFESSLLWTRINVTSDNRKHV